LLAGDNSKTSTFQMPGQEAVTIQADGRDLVPVGEAEFGLAWGRATDRLMMTRFGPQAEPIVVGLKVAAIAQYWGGVGHISAARSSESRFNAGNLFLYGAVVTFYVQF
jgi:hypothetical protein